MGSGSCCENLTGNSDKGLLCAEHCAGHVSMVEEFNPYTPSGRCDFPHVKGGKVRPERRITCQSVAEEDWGPDLSGSKVMFSWLYRREEDPHPQVIFQASPPETSSGKETLT